MRLNILNTNSVTTPTLSKKLETSPNTNKSLVNVELDLVNRKQPRSAKQGLKYMEKERN